MEQSENRYVVPLTSYLLQPQSKYSLRRLKLPQSMLFHQNPRPRLTLLSNQIWTYSTTFVYLLVVCRGTADGRLLVKGPIHPKGPHKL